VEFIDSMIPHHLGAMEMAQMEIAHGCNASVITMASRINESQAEEVEFMKNVRLEITGNDTVMPMANDTHMMEDMGLLMNASCIQLDRLFLEHMIPHHARAITMAHESLHKLTRDDLNTLAINIIDAQVNEISKLYHLLKCLDHSHGNDDAVSFLSFLFCCCFVLMLFLFLFLFLFFTIFVLLLHFDPYVHTECYR
jgi:uncharacterized protein (DUF305 family)